MIYIVLPAHNEAENVGPLLENLKLVIQETQLKYQVIVVNDGSTDQTRAVVQSFSQIMPIDIMDNEQQSGLSKTLGKGLIEATKRSNNLDIIITMDADNSQNPGLIPRMVSMIREGCDVVIASRYHKESRVIGVPFYRRILSYGASILLRLILPIRDVKDFTCGYRAYRATVLIKAFNTYRDRFIDQPGFSCMLDILLKLRSFPIVIHEVPMILRYDYKRGKSKMRVIDTVLETLLLIMKRRFGYKM